MNNKYIKNFVFFLLLGVSFTSRSQIISTYAGNGYGAPSSGGYSGDGGPATTAELYNPNGMAMDASGNVLVVDMANQRVRMVNTSGVISTIAGNGVSGYYGDGGPATAAELKSPSSIAVDAHGNIYIADDLNNRIRIVNSSGTINTFAGTGTPNYSGDGGPATAAELNYPAAVSVDNSGNLYIADANNNRIRMVNTSGTINTIAGNGTGSFSGDGGQATAAEINYPSGVWVASGNIYIADQDNNRIRMVNTSGIVSTFAGNGTASYSGDNGPATAAELNFPSNIASDAAGNIYIADASNNRIRIVSTAGTIYTLAGNGTAGYSGDGGQAAAAELDGPSDIFEDGSGNIYIGDTYNNRIRFLPGVTLTANTTQNVSCNGDSNGSASTTLTGGKSPYTYLWSPSGETSSTATGLKAGTYTVTVTDFYSLVSTATVTITQPAALSLFEYSNADTATIGPCDGSTWIAVTGGTKPYTYLWSPGSATTDTISNLCGGNYCCTVTDSHGCIDTICETVVGAVQNLRNSSSIHIYPDPTNGSYTVSGVTEGQIIELYNYMGQKISSTVADNLTMQFDISSSANGIYLIRILNTNGSVVGVQKILKTE